MDPHNHISSHKHTAENTELRHTNYESLATCITFNTYANYQVSHCTLNISKTTSVALHPATTVDSSLAPSKQRQMTA